MTASANREHQQHSGSEQVQKKKMTATMAAALADIYEQSGEVVRHQGGYWSYPSCARHAHNGVPEWHIGTSTVEALVVRGMLEYIEWKDGRNGCFPIRAKIPASALPSRTGGDLHGSSAASPQLHSDNGKGKENA